uniref:Uncharacterized protein n=1 Tax=Hyaloperonospora arabidopsidis (strain Emoy2) TaxID=559515 RepID=M4B741_HYAAE
MKLWGTERLPAEAIDEVYSSSSGTRIARYFSYVTKKTIHQGAFRIQLGAKPL